MPLRVTNIAITSISQPSNLITVVANITTENRGGGGGTIDPAFFNFHLTYDTYTYVSATPTDVSPKTAQTSDFTLTATFDYAGFNFLYVIGQSATYYINYQGNNETSQAYTYLNPNSFVFTSFTVVETSPNQITASAAYTSMLSIGSVEAGDFTYTVVISGTTYTYTTTSTPAFTPTVDSTSFFFIFTSTFTELFQDGDVQTHTLNFTKAPPVSLNVTSSPVELTYSATATMTLSFGSIVLDTDPNYVLTTFAYTYAAFTPNSANLFYKLNGTNITSSDVTWTLNNSTKIGTARFSIGTSQTAPIFIQVATITHQLQYLVTVGDPVGPFYSSVLNTVYTIANANNKAITKPITIITISANKTIILPPVVKVPGTLYHFKILTASAYTCKIYPFLTAPFTPTLRTYLYTTTSPAFDSTIETGSPYIFDSTTGLNTLTLVSDGTTWLIINRYINSVATDVFTGTLTQYLTETNETDAFQYTFLNVTSSYTKILLHSMSYSYLKYIFIVNSDSSTRTFIIYTPDGAPLETLSGRSGSYNYLTVSLAAGRVAGFVLTYSNGTYYIISTAVDPGITAITNFRDTSTVISRTLSFIQNPQYYEIPYLPTFPYSRAKLVIIKALTYPLSFRGEDDGTNNLVFQLTDAPVPAFSLPLNSAIWLIGFKSTATRQYYFPVSYFIR
jgi:hypothetical protein